MSPRIRLLLFLVGAGAVGALLVWGLSGLPHVGRYQGPYGDVINSRAVADRRAVNVVNSVTFDYRGFDTLGEEMILFAAVMGVTLLFRHGREQEHAPEDHAPERAFPHTSDAVRVTTLGAIGPTVLLGLYVTSHGHLSPGGGFQGGVVLATAPLFIYLSGRYLTFRTLNPIGMLDAAEGSGGGGFVIIGLVGLLGSGAFLFNFLGFGRARDLLSGGVLLPINLTVAVTVAAGIVLILFEFLEQTLMVRE